MFTLNAMKKMTMRCYIISNFIIAALFINVVLFGGHLAMGKAFTAGLATGLGTGWLIFAVAGWIELKRPGRTWDERMSAIHVKASAFSFWVLVLIVALLAPALRSETLGITMSAADITGMLVNIALVIYGVASLVLSRRL